MKLVEPMELIQLNPPTSPVLSLDEAKVWLRVDTDDDDDMLAAMIAAATARFDGRDGVLGRALAPQTWQLRMLRFPPIITLPLPPTIAVEAIEYIDTNNVAQTLAPSAYEASVGGWRAARVVPATGTTWPATKSSHLDTVRITFRAGYESAGSPPLVCVPEPIRHAMLMLLADWYDQRGNVVVGGGGAVAPMPFATEALIAPYRASSLV